jgi:feruloyl esterase
MTNPDFTANYSVGDPGFLQQEYGGRDSRSVSAGRRQQMLCRKQPEIKSRCRFGLWISLAFALILPRLLLAEQSCDGIKKLNLPATAITAVTSVSASSSRTLSQGTEVKVALCRVEGVIEQQIGFELWLPESGRWNERLLGAGVGGSAGTFNYGDMARGVNAGYAAVSTDSGHKMTDRTWMLNRQKEENYAYRAEHLMTEAAKKLVVTYYGRAAKHSYFLGCSGGGRQALKEMQRFPEDYDGIVAGAPGPDMPTLSVRHLWTSLFQKNHPEGQMSDADWQFLATAAISACDGNDGVKDGVVMDPASCSFDPKTIQCQGESRAGCLTAAQLEVVRAIYAPLKDENGKALDSGLFPGVRTRPGPPPQLAVDLFGQGVHHTTNWDPSSLNIVKELAAVDNEMPELKANDPHVQQFRDRGGKIIIYQGWMDPSVIASQSIDYYKSIEKTFGSENKTHAFLRLFMVPGMYHCAGGEATDHFGGSMTADLIGDPDRDLLSAVVRWVEDGIAPDRIIASKIVSGKVVRTRPLCPHPEQAEYKGSGSTDDAANYECRRAGKNSNPKK